MKLALNCLNYKYVCAIFDFGNDCIVGAESAEATLRLPPTGYREKIWDHVSSCPICTANPYSTLVNRQIKAM